MDTKSKIAEPTKPPPKKSGKRGLSLANAARDPEEDFDKPTRKDPETEAPKAKGSLLVEQPPKPKVVGDRMEVFYVKPIFGKTKQGTITVSLACTVLLEHTHVKLLPNIMADGYKDLLKKGRTGMNLNGIPGQRAAFYLSSDIKEETLVLPAAKVLMTNLSLIERKGEGAARKVIRLSFRLQVKLSREVTNFAEHNLQNNFWMTLEETQEDLFDEEEED